jgi:hypothetical protein
VLIRALSARACLWEGPGGDLSGWWFDWRRRNSARRGRSGMLKGPAGGGPEGRVEGKSV